MTERNWTDVATKLGAAFGERTAEFDEKDCFVADNYVDLKRERVFSMLVPSDLGGGGATYAQTCDLLRRLGQHCASTALALSMHQHLVAATVFKHKKGQPGAALLEKVATHQAVLVSTGATDWVDSNGSARRVDGGYRVNGRKVFGSGGPGADMLITSFAADDEPEGPSVIHCPVPLDAEGVNLLDDWHTLGMRGTGSHTVLLKDVFVPEGSVALKRPKGQWHPAWDVALGVAPPIYMAPYVGLAEAAAEQVLERARKRRDAIPVQLAAARMENVLTTARLAWQDMVRLAGNCDFTPSLDNSNAQLVRKTIVNNAVKEAVACAMEVAGGSGFYKSQPFERMWRDIQASHYHPLPERRQLIFTGRYRLGADDFWNV